MPTSEKYINIFTDFGFKKLFGSEPNKDLLLDFLNELLKHDTAPIIDLSFLSSEQLGRSSDARKAIFDIYCENTKGEKFIVELQKAKQNYFKDRSIYYSTFPIQQQAEQGDWNFKLQAVYTIGILDFVFDEGKEDKEIFHHEVKLIERRTQKVFYDKLTYIYLEMPKFTKTLDELETHFEKWLYILKNINHLTNRPAKLQEKVFAKLFEQAEIANYSQQDYDAYQESLKVYRDLKNVIDTAYDEGLVEGEAKGLALGKEQGLTEGLRLAAQNMKKQGLSYEVISQITGLNISEIEQL
jgi:predicted transposase/invertase (TIGR01784 family)